MDESLSPHKVTLQLGERQLTIETGTLAKQANGSVIVTYGETVVLGTATMNKPLYEDGNFLPLLVDYEERFYAAGKIKGSRFIKREGRPRDEAILTARLIDRAIRPLFPDGMINNIQVVLTILSYDGQNDPDIPAMIAAFAALSLSGIPWKGPLGAVRVGLVDDQLVINPTTADRLISHLDLILAGTGQDVAMIEAGAHEVTEEVMLNAIDFGQKAIKTICDGIQELTSKVPPVALEGSFQVVDEAKVTMIQEKARPLLAAALDAAHGKEAVAAAEKNTSNEVYENLTEDQKETITFQDVANAVHELHGSYARARIIADGVRSDGRKLEEIRSISIKTGILPRTHGSGLFQRGDTQVLTTLTLGGPADMMILDSMEDNDEKKRYIHYYNFPGFSVGEAKPSRGPGRREVGHGALAERALLPVLPDREEWPYMMLLVSEVLESHGSSSMASVCGSTLALMDAGVPIKKPVAGIAMGLMSNDQGQYQVVTDIAGIEDEQGDMDFKVAGSRDGITALQMDIKVIGLTREMLEKALSQAKTARLSILDKMAAVIAEPRPDLSPYAPRIHTVRVPVEKIGDLIGPKGKHINEIIEETGVEIDIDDDGLVSITTNDAHAMEKAKEWVHNMTREIKAGERFEGRVTRIMDFGAFVELVPNVEGMVHISQFREERVDRIEDVVKVGQIIPVVVVEIDSMGRINLSHKATLPGYKGEPSNSSRPEKRNRPPRSGKPGFRGPRAPRR